MACANGTDALRLALIAVGIQPGDELITPPNTFMATVEAIEMVGASPAFVDIDMATYNLCPEKLDEFLAEQCVRDADGRLRNIKTGRPVTGIIPVHLYGLPVDMTPILTLAHQYGLRVVEDACQAHGADYRVNGSVKRAGALGDAAAFSFYPAKNLGAIGEAGAITTNDPEIAEQMKMLRDHGQRAKYIHALPNGWNSRLDTIQCAVLEIKLQRLNAWNEHRRQVAIWYHQYLAGNEQIVLPVEPNGRRHVYHLYVVRVANRDEVRRKLQEAGISTGLHYPIPVHLQPAYQDRGWQKGDYPETEVAANTMLSLPMFPHITEAQVAYVCDILQVSLVD